MKTICELLDAFKGALFVYKKNLLLRVLLVAGAAIVTLAIALNGQKSVMATIQYLIATPLIIGYFEYTTINVIFDKEFYPLDMFADQIFSSRESFGYKALYIGYYVIFWCLVFYYICTFGLTEPPTVARME